LRRWDCFAAAAAAALFAGDHHNLFLDAPAKVAFGSYLVDVLKVARPFPKRLVLLAIMASWVPLKVLAIGQNDTPDILHRHAKLIHKLHIVAVLPS